MKLEHPKNWYEKNSAIEGNSEIGAGIPPGAQTQARKSGRLPSIAALGTVHAHARQSPKVRLPRTAMRHPTKVCCHA